MGFAYKPSICKAEARVLLGVWGQSELLSKSLPQNTQFGSNCKQAKRHPTHTMLIVNCSLRRQLSSTETSFSFFLSMYLPVCVSMYLVAIFWNRITSFPLFFFSSLPMNPFLRFIASFSLIIVAWIYVHTYVQHAHTNTHICTCTYVHTHTYTSHF